MNRQVRYIAQRVIVGVLIAFALSAAHKAFASDVLFGYYVDRSSALSACQSTQLTVAGSGGCKSSPRPYESGSSIRFPFAGAGDYQYTDGDGIFAFSSDGSCPSGFIADSSGHCVDDSNDPAENCPVEGNVTGWKTATLDIGNVILHEVGGAKGGTYNILPTAQFPENGCLFTYQSAGSCFPAGTGKVKCTFRGKSLHKVVDGDGGDTNLQAEIGDSDQGDGGDAPDSVDTPEKINSSKEPTVDNQNSDGSSTVIDVSKTVTTGKGFNVIHFDPVTGTYNGSSVQPSTSQTTYTTTTETRADGTVVTTFTQATGFANGRRLTYTVNPETGVIVITGVDGTTGGGSKTTVTTHNPDGSTTTETTTDGNAEDADCDDDGCADLPAPSDDDGGDSDGDGVEGEGTCDPTQGDCEQSDKGGKFAGSPFPGLDDQPSFGDSVGNLFTGLQGIPLLSAVNSISAGVPSSGDCPMGSVHIEMLDADFDLSSGCDLYDQNRAVLSLTAKAAWSLLAVVIFLGI